MPDSVRRDVYVAHGKAMMSRVQSSRRRARRAAELTLRLYVAGEAPNSMRARANLEAICARLGCPPALEVIDLMVDPVRALADRILVTPTLVKAAPAPIRRVIGDLRDVTHVLLLLGHK